jgi:hypothetical protein
MKMSGERSKAYWRKSDIVAHFYLMFGTIRPDCVQALLDAGFPDVVEKAKKRKPRPKKPTSAKPKVKS